MNGYPYGGSPYPDAPYGAPAPAGPARYTPAASPEGKRALFLTANLLGAGLLGYMVLTEAVSAAIGLIPAVRTLYNTQPVWVYIINILFTYTCVGLPMLVVYLILRRTGCQQGLTLPLGGAYRASDGFLLVLAGLGVCLIGNVVTGYIGAYAEYFGIGFYSYREMAGGDTAPEGALQMALYVLQTALLPALIEEFAFRGVVLQSLRKFGDTHAIVFSALLFALMHRNLTQFFFAFIAGLALGYVAVVTGSLWTGIAIHCLNNSFSVLVVILSDKLPEARMNLAYTLLMYGLIAVGLIAGGVYLYLRRKSLRLRRGVYGRIDNKALWTLVSPVMLVAVLWMLVYMALDIIPVRQFFGVAS